MTIDRRQLLGSAGAGLTLTLPAAARAARGPDYGALPMPAPVDGLRAPLPVGDPSRIGFDQGWLFHEGDIAVPPAATHNETYLRAKAGNAVGAAAIDYDDSDWPLVTLPHDWASFQPFVESANVAQGYRPRGIGWYRRSFHLDPASRGQYCELQFDGIATNATIWVNGSVVAHNWSGYNSIYVDITPFARFGDERNVVAIRVDAEAMEGWWYEGAGLYRHAWLARRAPVSIVTDGVHCDPRAGSGGGWSVPVTVTARSTEAAAVGVRAVARLLDSGGRTVATATTDMATVPPLGQGDLTTTLTIADPALWSVATPTLYTVTVALERDGATVDARSVPVGFRTIRFDADRGFSLNGAPVKLKGVCIHHDHAGVGVALPDALMAWRLERLKELGCNAIRCSHNAPPVAFLDLCDRMGFLVMDENRNFNPSPDYMAQLEWLVRRDRNHPSVILWSVFNEEPMQGTHAGVEMVRRMAAAVKRLDDSRPVTAAMNGAFFNPENVSTVVDVVGFNYYPGDYDKFHALNPTKPMTSSEDTSAFETRGAYQTIPAKNIRSSMDDDAAGWGETHRKGWAEIARRPFVAGGFVWTGFDYHGEPTPHVWPTISSFFGILDLCGFRKTAYDIHRAGWIDDAPVVGLAPHWTWPGREGQPVPILVLSNAERITLRLNGRVVGEAAVDRLMGNSFTVPYAPGTIEVIASIGGREVARAGHETAGPPVALRLTPARRAMAGDGEDVQPVTIDAIDARGRHVPTANLPTRFVVTGATIIGVGNGDPNSHESEKGDSATSGARSLFNGLAQVIVQADAGGRGRITLRATAPGLRPAALTIDRIAAAPRAQVAPLAATRTIDDWRRSPLLAARPDASLAPAENDNNSWAFVHSGTATPAEAQAGWQVYRASVTPVRVIAAKGGRIAFAAVAGRAELWVDGRKLADKAGAAVGPITAALPAGAGPRAIVLIVAPEPGRPSGIVGPVTISAG
ncbi:beta-galactosidase GalA [Sphingomonas sp. RIT328]|uniref:beta-galactosidase GalA n=1 Tax=Sphingomonas sp. RIT328 TaxID=1470591 RepID=UPI000446C5FB|nr:beta-galactosidase GalA [Sphingomonas sp. RIT328]EZP57231.1 Glycosyl hydrolases family 2, sugar binding domain protein [Sphingomonas sp. RIT328]